MRQRNASDPAQVKKAERAAKEAEEQRALDLKGLLKLPEFRRYLYRWIWEKQLALSPFNSNGSTMSLNVGRQDMAREMLHEIRLADVTAFATILREQAEEELRVQPEEP